MLGSWVTAPTTTLATPELGLAVLGTFVRLTTLGWRIINEITLLVVSWTITRLVVLLGWFRSLVFVGFDKSTCLRVAHRKSGLTLLRRHPSIGQEKFLVLGLDVIKDDLNLSLILEHDILGLLNVSAKSADSRTTENIVDEDQSSARSESSSFPIAKELENVANGEDGFDHVFALEMRET